MKKLLLIVVFFAIIDIIYGQDSEPDYLCFEVTAGTKISLTTAGVNNCNFLNVNVEYSYNKTTWKQLSQSAITVSNDCFIYFRGKNTAFYDPNLGNIHNPSLRAGFYVSKPFKCSGNIMTLIDKKGETTSLNQYAFHSLFLNCPILTSPKLPATKLAYRCYCGMFSGCTKLVSAPALPALELASNCYNNMFSGCTSLVNAPDLPAITLAKECYAYMFKDCTSLKNAPKIKDVSQFAVSAYYQMFNGCTNLNYISVEFSQWHTAGSSNSPITEYWVHNVASSGTFVCPKDLEQKYGDNYIPTGWKEIKYLEDLYSITIPESSHPYITIAETTEIDANTEITFSITDRTSEGYTATVSVQGTNPIETTQSGNDYTFTMPAEDVTISVSYTPIKYSITTDEYSSAVAEASAGETVDVTFANRDGYSLSSATYNGTALTITNNTASFTMTAANVSIATTYTPIEYNITAGDYVTANKTKATINDQVSFTVADRTADGYQLNKVLINNIEFSGTSFNMADYLTDVTITAVYSKIGYTITADQYSTPNKTTANVGDEITVTFANRDGYNLTSATYNGNPLTIPNNTATFTMPPANVTIATTYTPIEYNITAGEYVTANKSKATINDQVSFTVADRTAAGYQLNKVLINNTEFSGTTFNMADYLTDVTITAVYSKINYSIITDEHSSADKNSANVGDKINVNFSNIPGHYIFRAVCNGNELIVEDYGSWFTMPAENAYVATSYLPIEYNITAGEYVTANKAKATINDQVSFTVADRTADGYQLNKVLINNTEFSGTSFNMADYLTDVTITAVYSKIGYTITSDAYSTPSKTKANVGDEITVTFSKRDGYNLTSATYNGTALTIVDYKSQFTMPDEDVEIKTVYTVEQQQITKPEIITDNNVEITLPENLTENTEVTFTVQQKPGFTAFVYVNGVLTNEYKFVFTGKVEIKVDYKELTVSNISAETESYCAGDEINLTFATNPYAVEYELTFSNEAQKEGFENIDFLPVASYEKQPASFKIPQSAKPGKYHAFIRVKDSKDSHSKQYAFDFEVLYPTDIIETKYSDLICVNNSKNEYIGYQWFKDNKGIKGADKQFYIDAPMLNGSYSVALILKNGEKIRTCNYIVNNPTLKKSLKPSVNVYPNPAKASAPVVVELSEMDDLTDAYILIYNQLGVQIDKITNLSPHNTLSLKKGFYHGVVICGSTKLTFKIIVNE